MKGYKIMRRILITGANSYIGKSFEQYIKTHYEDAFEIDTVDMIGDAWKNYDFSPYDSVFHVAGIAHADTSNVSEETKALYYKVNTDLTVETAKKAKQSGVKQFVFMSSMIVYATNSDCITKDTKPNPDNFYGDSKLKAEEGILALNDETFKVVVLRPPMIYGPNSKGNYPLLSKFAKTFPVFPYVTNKRSMLYVENLAEFVRLIIENEDAGIFFPQNTEYVNTSELVRQIAKVHGKKVILVKGFDGIIKALAKKVPLFGKAFGNLYYESSMSAYKSTYQTADFEKSIIRTEGENHD